MVHIYTALVSIFLPPLLLLPHFSDWEKGEKFGYLLLLPRPTAGIYTIHYAMAASSHVRHTLDRDCCTISISLPTNTHTLETHTAGHAGHVYEFDCNLFFFFFYWGEAGKNVIGPAYQNVVHRRWTRRKKRQLLLLLLLEEISYSFSAGVPHPNDCCWAIRIFPSSIVWPFFLLLLAGLWRLNHEEVVDIICCYHDDDATDRTQKINHAIVGEGNINRHFYVMISLGKEKMPLLWPACKRSTREAKFLAGIK